MPRVCAITKKRTMYGQNVSHSNNKTKRKFSCNLQFYKIRSGNKIMRLRLSRKGLRTIEKRGIHNIIHTL
jgi:large subunit ribosomal protein L28